MSKREKLCMLSDYVHLESGKVIESAFGSERVRYQRAIDMKRVAAKVGRCRDCLGCNVTYQTESAMGVGSVMADVVFVGQSLYRHEMASSTPLLLESGYLIDAALRLSGVSRDRVYITNAVKCHVRRRSGPSEAERVNCLSWLKAELAIVAPRLVIAMGVTAQVSVKTVYEGDGKVVAVKHPAVYGGKSAGAEASVGYVIKLSDVIDKVIGDV